MLRPVNIVLAVSVSSNNFSLFCVGQHLLNAHILAANLGFRGMAGGGGDVNKNILTSNPTLSRTMCETPITSAVLLKLPV